MNKTWKFVVYRLNANNEYEVFQSSTSIDSFDNNDRWFFSHIIKNNNEYIKIGDIMYSIEYV